MASIKTTLIIGGGIAGMSAAIQLRKRGIQVDLVELDPDWRVYGAGITLSGPTLRALTEIGVIDAILSTGWCADGADLYMSNGTRIGELPTARIGRADVPGAGGILRPELARILREHTLASGVAVRCGTTFSSIEPDANGVQVAFTDERSQRYDLVVAADGLHSKTRELIFPDVSKPAYTGQASWRAVLPRPADITRIAMFMGPDIKAGINPVSNEQMYLFVTEPRAKAEFIDETLWPETLRQMLAPFGGIVGEIRDGLNASSRILYRPFFSLLAPPPWHRGRVVIIGDAAHATTPHLASGAGIGVEDAIVLAEELDRASSVEDALSGFTDRRYERCRIVVENSLRLGDMERLGLPKEQHENLMRETMKTLLAPI